MAARPSQPKYHYLRSWLTGEGYGEGFEPRPVVLECIRSRSGMSMTVYDRGERIFTVNGCGFDRIGTALGRFMEELFQPELQAFRARMNERRDQEAKLTVPVNVLLERWKDFYGIGNTPGIVRLEGACGLESMIKIAKAIGLKVHQSETKAGFLLIIERGEV